ncbi:MAG: LysR family transcriptional regulator [Thiolinea sp.]
MELLDLRKLRVLVAVEETGSATRAGEQLHLGQSAISQTLKEIQQELGLPLFERAGRGLKATAAGARLAAEGRRVLAALHHANTVAAALQRGEQDEIGIGVMTPFIQGEIARCIAQFSAARPDLTLTLESHGKDALQDRVLHGELDIGVVIGSINEPGLTTFATIAMRVVCIAPPGHPLAERDMVTHADLQTCRQIILTEGSPLRLALETAGFALSGNSLRPVIKAGTQRAIVTMVETGAGVALVDPLVLAPQDRVVVRPFEPALHVNLSMFARDDWQEHSAVAELARALYQALTPLSGDGKSA